ncbi:hypothetical protein O2604_17210 [Pseudomonas aeruginosa]|uniref:hypothetical protein n=1 Tax=Pseudomonas aeruginosa TaxID=287 RepID=UPI0022AE6ABB|nr:hypothetical protein [Pseudomonas aeruginosa]WAW38801.1 hypothetical protein O2604_17210 [Pseudomonas aeruginosa]
MSEVKRYINCVIGMTGVEMVRATDYAKLAAEAKALREEVAALKHSQQVLIGSRNAHRDERDAARKEVAELRMARDDFKLERDLARQNFCDEQAANYQLQANLKACLGELSELRARAVVVPERLTNGDSISRMLREIGCDGDVSYHHAREIWNACLDELARLNGKTVSEGLLRRVCAEPPATCCMDDEMTWRRDIDSALLELRALLNQDKENGNG